MDDNDRNLHPLPAREIAMSTARLLYADSTRSSDMYYASGIFVPDPFYFIAEESGDSHILVSSLEVDRVRAHSKARQVHDLAQLQERFRERIPVLESGQRSVALLALFLEERGIDAVRVPGDFPLIVADFLRQREIRVEAVAGSFFPERAHKTPLEVAAIEEALVITALGMTRGIALIARSVIDPEGFLRVDGEILTSEAVRGEIDATLVRNGAMPAHTIVSGGLQAADPHEVGHGPLRGHQAIILDVFPRVQSSGYYGDMTRTVCRGRPPERVRAAWEAVRQGQEIAFALICAGAEGRVIHQAILDHLTERGFPTAPTADGRQGGFFHGTGHGLGLDVHEVPRIGLAAGVLEAGHVVTVEPGLYYPDMGGVRLEDVVVVAEGGCRNLTPMEKFLEV